MGTHCGRELMGKAESTGRCTSEGCGTQNPAAGRGGLTTGGVQTGQGSEHLQVAHAKCGQPNTRS